MSADLPPQLPHGILREVLPDVFVVAGQTRPVFGGRQLQFSRGMVVLREGEALTLVNTLRLDDAGLAALNALGRVEHVVRLGAFHGRDDAFYVGRSGARVWAFEGMPHERGVVTTDLLVEGGDAPVAGARAFQFHSSSMPEGLLILEAHGGVAIACDSLQTMAGPDDFFDDATAGMMAGAGFFQRPNIGPGWLSAAKPKRADFDRLLETPFEHLLSAHGPPLSGDASAAVATAVDRVAWA
jgi:hypothetical protein